MLLMVTFSFFEEERPLVRWSVFISAIIVITLMAGLRPIGIDKDSYNYVGYYWGTSDDIVEQSFIYISNFVRVIFDDVRWVFIIYAFIAIPLKCFAFTKLSDENTGLYIESSAYVYELYKDEMKYGKIK